MKKHFRLISMIILLSALSACGTQDKAADMSGEDYGQEEYFQGEYVYVPEFYTFEQPDNINWSDVKLRGDKLYPAMFDQPVTYVGYPNVYGSANAVMRCNTLYGISAASGNKEGAWAFIPASNEPSSRACTNIWRMPRGS